jgi:hypothetical protein
VFNFRASKYAYKEISKKSSPPKFKKEGKKSPKKEENKRPF